jgi:hypothetical protein
VALDFIKHWSAATPWEVFLRPEMEQYQLWKGISDRVILPGWALEGFMRSPVRKLLVIGADWCIDAASTVPVFARLADLVKGIELRLLDRDSFPEAMDAYRTNGTRSIPIVIALNDGFEELGHWGPRPAVLQAWVISNKKMIPSPQRIAYARQWYAKDKGQTPLKELLTAVGGER